MSDVAPYVASGYTYGHDTSMTNSYPSYQHAMVDTQNGGGYAHHPTGGQYAGYGSVAYPTSSAAQDIQSMDTRKRAIEALNDFLGECWSSDRILVRIIQHIVSCES